MDKKLPMKYYKGYGGMGNGNERKVRLENARYHYQEVQDRVNELLGE